MSRLIEGSHMARLRHGCGSVVLENRTTLARRAEERAAMESAWASFVQTRVGSAKRYGALTGCSLATAEKRRLGALPQPDEFAGLTRAFGCAWLAAIARDHLISFIENQEAQTHDARQALAAALYEPGAAASSGGVCSLELVAERTGATPVEAGSPPGRKPVRLKLA
jgi:hypothetical protein